MDDFHPLSPLKSHEFTLDEIAANFQTLTNGNKKEVQKWLDVYELMHDYLEYIGEPDIYTALSGTEEAFLNLYATKKSLESGRTKNESWDYTEIDVTELQLRYYDYIRIGKGTHDFRIFKKIFVNQDRWSDFNKKVQQIVDEVSDDIPDIDRYRQKYPDETENRISEIRNHDFREKAEKALNQIYGSENAFIVSKADEETPLKIAQQAYQKLEKLYGYLEANSIDRMTDIDDLVNKIKEVQKIAGKIKMKID